MKCKICKNNFENDNIKGRKKIYCSIKCSSKAYYLKNKMRLNIKKKEWTELNKEKVKEYNKQWINKNRNRFNELMLKNYYKNNDKWKIRKYSNKFNIKNDFFEYKNNKCQICQINENLEIHHKKYTKNYDDWQLLCRECHIKKHINS